MPAPWNPAALCRNHELLVARELKLAMPSGDCLLTHRATSKGGYPSTSIEIDGRRRIWHIHRIVMLVKRGPKPEGTETRHLCGDKRCINPDHLVYAPRYENARDTQEHGRSNVAKLTRDEVADIRRRFVPGKNQWQKGNRDELASEYGLNPEYLRQLAGGRCWKRVEA